MGDIALDLLISGGSWGAESYPWRVCEGLERLASLIRLRVCETVLAFAQYG